MNSKSVKPGSVHQDAPSNSSDFNIEEYIPFRLVHTQIQINRAGQPKPILLNGNEIHLTKGDWRILISLYLERLSSPTDINNNLGMDRAIITRHITSLITKGLIQVRKDHNDRRRKTMHLTDDGVFVASKITAVMKDFGSHLDASLTRNEKDTLMKILNKLVASCENYKR